MSIIGCDKLHYCPMTDKDAETYGTPVAFKKLKEIDINPQTDTTKEYYDDQLGETNTTLSGITVTIQVSDLTAEETEALLGAEIDENGVLIQKSTDAAPYVAIMFRSLKSDEKNYRHVCLYKGKFALPQESAKTKGEKVEYQPKTLTGEFMPLLKNKNWKASIDTDSKVQNAAKVIEDWFKHPYGEGTVATHESAN